MVLIGMSRSLSVCRLLGSFQVDPHLYGDELDVRDWTYVDDHSRAKWEILTRTRPGEVYLVGADCEMSSIEAPHMILTMIGKDFGDFVDWASGRQGHDRCYAVDASKPGRELGWQPVQTDFESGLREAIT